MTELLLKKFGEQLKKVFGDSALSYAAVKQWIVLFYSGNKEITDKPRSGRHASAATTVNKARVDELIRADRRITLQNIIDDIGIGKSTMCNIMNDLAYSKVCALWVPRQLTTELKQSRLEVRRTYPSIITNDHCPVMNAPKTCIRICIVNLYILISCYSILLRIPEYLLLYMRQC